MPVNRFERMTKTSQWAGYCASVFAISFFVTALEFRGSGGQVPGWFAVVTGWFMMLAAFSGVVCLVSAVFGFARQRKGKTTGREILHAERPE
jgi:ABC-type Fe3+-siderophore transport system permease subunit